MKAASKSTIERTGIHRSLIRSIERYRYRSEGLDVIQGDTKDALHQYVTHTAKDLGNSLDALILHGPTRIEFWHKDQPWCCKYFGNPASEAVVRDYILQPEWTYPEGGRFGIAVASHPILAGNDSKGSIPLRLRLVEGEHTRVDTRGIMLQSQEGIVVRLLPEKENACSASIVSCIDRQHAPAVYDRWFTKKVQQHTGIAFKRTQHQPQEQKSDAAREKYGATLTNGWAIGQHTTYLAPYGRPPAAFIHTQRIDLRRERSMQPFPLEAVHWLLEHEPKVESWAMSTHTIHAQLHGEEHQITERITPLSRQEEESLRIGLICGIMGGYSHETARLRTRDALSRDWHDVTALRINAREHDLTAAQLNGFLRQLSQYAQKQ